MGDTLGTALGELVGLVDGLALGALLGLVDGALVGGASLKAADFSGIIAALEAA